MLFAQAVSTAPVVQRANELRIGVEGGYRLDDFRWNIAGTNGVPNILSELTWTDLKIAQLRTALDWSYRSIVVHAEASYGRIEDGENQDSDYNGNNRTQEFMRSENGTGGDVGDASIGLGYRWIVFDASAHRAAYLVPMVGYALDFQYLDMRDGYQVVDTINGNTGPINGLNSSYDATWHGPWLGLYGQLAARERLSLDFKVEYHFNVDYEAEADWNLRSDLAHPVSFDHVADGEGFRLNLGVTYQLTPRLLANVGYDAFRFTAENGIDTTYATNGSVLGVTRLNEADWRSRALTVSVSYRF